MRRLIIIAVLIFAPWGNLEAKYKRSKKVLADFQKLHPCPATGLKTGACPGWVKDHIKPLECGGPDAVENLQWQTTEDAKAKDQLENSCCRRGLAKPVVSHTGDSELDRSMGIKKTGEQ